MNSELQAGMGNGKFGPDNQTTNVDSDGVAPEWTILRYTCVFL